MAKKTNLKLKKPQLRQPSTAPIDAVRNPNFDAALAQQDFRNALAQSLANYNAQNYTSNGTGQLAANPNVPNLMPIGGLGGMRPDQAGITEDQKKILDDLMAKRNATAGGQDFIDSRDPNKMYTQDMVDYIDPTTGEKVSRTRGVIPAPGSRFVPVNQAGMYGQRAPQGPQVGGGLGGQQGSEEQRRMALNPGQPSGGGLGGQQPTNPMVGYGSQQPGNMQVPNMPQNKMADFNNFLQQGMQRNQDMNQAAQNFAGMGGPQKSFSQVAGGINRMNRMPRKPRPNAISPSNQKLI